MTEPDDAWRLTDPDPEVRLDYVIDLPSRVDDPPPDHPVVRLLLQAFDDEDDEVRDWAVFGLGVQLEVDSPEIRDALLRMLDDAGEADTVGEAAVALARRHDPRVLDRVLAELEDVRCGNLWVEAAAEYGDPLLLPALLRLKQHAWDRDPEEGRPGLLDEALRACGGGGPN